MDIHYDTVPPECHDRRDADAAGGGPAVTIISIAELSAGLVDDERVGQLTRLEQVTVDVTDWVDLPAEAAMRVAENFTLLAERGVTADFRVAEKKYHNAFTAAMAVVENSAGRDVTAMQRVLVLLASRRPVAGRETDADQILGTLRDAGVKYLKKTTLLKEIKVDAAAASVYREPKYVGDVLISDDLPAGAAGLEVPSLYELTEMGVWGGTPPSSTLVAKHPLLVVKRTCDLATGRRGVTIAWREAGGWVRRDAGVDEISDARTVLGLAAFGMPVHSGTARAVVAYLHDFNHANEAVLPAESTLGRCGWVDADDPVRGFLLPQQHLRGDDSQREVLRLRPAGDGTAATLMAVRERGTLAEWQAAMQLGADRPVVRLALLAALATPLLALLKRQNFLVLLSCPTSRGKTTTQRVAGSVWGYAGSGDRSLLHSMNHTSTWSERTAHATCDLPLILDDLENALERRS